MELALKAFLLAACAFNFVVQTLYFTHMMQLNSYRNERYRQWLRKNDAKLADVRHLLPGLLLPAMYLPSKALCYGLGGAVLVITAILNWPKKAKKPLVFTPRVRRLLATQYLLLAVVIVAGALLGYMRCVGIVALFSLIHWAWTWLANTINTPMEKAIAGGYVKDARRRLEERPDLTVIGITGSYGKTSTKTFLQALLAVRYNVLMTPESYNTTMGVVRTIRERLTPSHQIFIAEMGAKNPGDIREICELVHPTYGILTSIGEQHLETFRTIDNIIATKFELADAIPEDGCLFLNVDNEYIRTHAVSVPTVTYGTGKTAADYTATQVTVDAQGSSFTLTAPNGESRRFSTKLLGAHNIQNLAGCIAVAHRFGIPLEELVYPVRMLKPVEHRLELLPNGFIDDAYNSNPAGFRGALEVLSGFDAQRVLVTPGMVELGDRQEALNRELGEYAASRCDYAVLVGIKQAPPLKEGLLAGGFPEEKIFVAETLQQGLAHLQGLSPDPGRPRIVLLENDLPDNF